jgi:hypothetical protein
LIVMLLLLCLADRDIPFFDGELRHESSFNCIKVLLSHDE